MSGTRLQMACLVSTLLLAGCGDDPTAQVDPPRLLNSWDLDTAFPGGILVDGASLVRVVAPGRIESFQSDGSAAGTWAVDGASGGPAFDADGNILVPDWTHHRILKYDPSGALLATWGKQGTGDGDFQRPFAIAVDRQGLVYVTDSQADRVQKFDAGGVFLVKWGVSSPTGIAVGDSGTVYVVSSASVMTFDSSGHSTGKFGSNFLNLVAVDSSGDVFVSGNGAVSKYSGKGSLLAQWNNSGGGHGHLAYTFGIWVTPGGTVYVTDAGYDAGGNSFGRVSVYAAPTAPEARPDPGGLSP